VHRATADVVRACARARASEPQTRRTLRVVFVACAHVVQHAELARIPRPASFADLHAGGVDTHPLPSSRERPEGGRCAMKKSSLFAVFVLLVSTAGVVPRASAQPDVVLRDTTGFPAPGPGMARLVIVRERQLRQDPKPEFVYVDRTPVGVILPKTGVTAIVPAGVHRVWLGRGLNVGAWVNAAPGGRYLLRMREVIANGTWYADFIIDSPEGYAEFAQQNGFKLAVSGPGSMGSLERNLQKVKNDPKADSLAKLRAIARATLPIQVAEVWYQDLDNPPSEPMEYEHHPGRLVVDESALRFSRGDTVALEIPRPAITGVRYGGSKDDRPNAWIKIGYTVAGAERRAAFTCTRGDSATIHYNRLFEELSKPKP
jgi:hypothetical protein